ncbi:phage portal protein [Kribbella sp. WER1]
MALTEDERNLIAKLDSNLSGEQSQLDTLSKYYDLEQRLRTLGIAIPPEVSALQVVVNWPRLAVDSLEERLDIDGFRVGGADGLSDDLWALWKANELDTESSLGHTDALIYGRSVITVGTNEGSDLPLISVESPTEITVDRDPRTRQVRAAFRRYGAEKTATGISQDKFATLYLPDETVWLELSDGGWKDTNRDQHNMGQVGVFPITNRARISDVIGRSAMSDVIPLTDSVGRTLTNLELAKEFHAVPQRYALGVVPGDFQDADGNPLTAWQSYIGHYIAIGDNEAKIGQLNASDLNNFVTVVNLYAKLVSSVTGLPPHFLGYTDGNPASADAIRSAEVRLVKRAERMQRRFGGSWEKAQAYAVRLMTGEQVQVSAVWRDASTPTFSAKADGATKLYSAGVVPIEGVWDELGYSQERQARYRELMDAASPVGALARVMNKGATDGQADPTAP